MLRIWSHLFTVVCLQNWQSGIGISLTALYLWNLEIIFSKVLNWAFPILEILSIGHLFIEVKLLITSSDHTVGTLRNVFGNGRNNSPIIFIFFLCFKALLHCAIFSATCLAMVANLALQVAAVWCWGPVTLCNFLSNLSRNVSSERKTRSVRMRPC